MQPEANQSYTLTELMQCAAREVGMRETCYVKWDKKASVSELSPGRKREIGMMRAIEQLLADKAATPAPAAAQGAGEALEAYYARQIEWSRATFGPAQRTKGIIDHITKELREIAADPHDLSEWIDVVILAMDGFWRHGGTPTDLMACLQAKQEKNMARTWPGWRTMSEDQAIEHDRMGEASEAAPAAPEAGPGGAGASDEVLRELGSKPTRAGLLAAIEVLGLYNASMSAAMVKSVLAGLPILLARVRAAEALSLQAFQDSTCLSAIEETLSAYLNNEDPSLSEVKGFALERAMRQIKQRTFIRPIEAVKGGQPHA